MSYLDQQSDEGDTRKSKRQRKPNPYYTVGINQLKKPPNKVIYKKSKLEDADNYSSDQERMNLSSNYRNQDSYYQKQQIFNSWLPCVLSNNKSIKVQIIIDTATMDVLRVKQQPLKNITQAPVGQSRSPVVIPLKKPEPTPKNLFMLFTQAIQDVQGPKITTQTINQSKQIIPQPPPKLQNKPSQPRPKTIQQDKDGRILSVIVNHQNKVMTFNHSKLGLYQIPIDQQTKINQQQIHQEDIAKINQWKTIINLNAALIKNIDIYT